MELPVYIIILALCSGALARTSYYMDVILHSYLPQEAKNSNLDPAHLTNFTTESQDKITFVNVKVKMNYYGGQMIGLLKGRRSGDCSPVRSTKGNVTMNCTLLFKDIKFEYQAKMKYGQLPSANVKASGKLSPVNANAEVTTSFSYNSPYLKQLKLSQTVNVEAKFTGLGPLNSQLKKLTEKAFVGHVISEFHNLFSSKYLPTLARAIKHIPMPLH